MPSTRDAGAEPPYRQIAAEIGRRVDSGELVVGEPVPSTRQITREWGVAMATATKVLATLRQEGLVQPVPGVGTVVRDRRLAPSSPSGSDPGQGTGGPAHPPAVPGPAPARIRGRDHRELTQESVVGTAVEVADADGLPAVSMRRVAAELGVGAMTLYRYVGGKEELFQLMADTVFGEDDLPEPGPDGWRDRLELVSRLQWQVYRRHPWVISLVASVSVPPLMPSGMAQVEWQLRALRGFDLDPLTQIRTLITLSAFVGGIALSREVESEALRGRSVAGREWRSTNVAAVDEIFASGRFPLLAGLDVDDSDLADLDAMFEFGLQRQLDGVAAFLEPTPPLPPPPTHVGNPLL